MEGIENPTIETILTLLGILVISIGGIAVTCYFILQDLTEIKEKLDELRKDKDD